MASDESGSVLAPVAMSGDEDDEERCRRAPRGCGGAGPPGRSWREWVRSWRWSWLHRAARDRRPRVGAHPGPRSGSDPDAEPRVSLPRMSRMTRRRSRACSWSLLLAVAAAGRGSARGRPPPARGRPARPRRSAAHYIWPSRRGAGREPRRRCRRRARRSPAHPVGWLFLALGRVIVLAGPVDGYAAYAPARCAGPAAGRRRDAWRSSPTASGSRGSLLVALILLLTPDGHVPVAALAAPWRGSQVGAGVAASCSRSPPSSRSTRRTRTSRTRCAVAALQPWPDVVQSVLRLRASGSG